MTRKLLVSAKGLSLTSLCPSWNLNKPSMSSRSTGKPMTSSWKMQRRFLSNSLPVTHMGRWSTSTSISLSWVRLISFGTRRQLCTRIRSCQKRARSSSTHQKRPRPSHLPFPQASTGKTSTRWTTRSVMRSVTLLWTTMLRAQVENSGLFILRKRYGGRCVPRTTTKIFSTASEMKKRKPYGAWSSEFLASSWFAERSRKWLRSTFCVCMLSCVISA